MSSEKLGPPEHIDPIRPPSVASDFEVSLDGINVLVVDDESDTRRMITATLQVHGAIVTQANCGEAALQLLQEQKFDVLLSDLGMEPMDGLVLMREVRLRGIKTPSVALSAYTGLEAQKQALEAGFQMHLDKPVITLQLAAAVADMADLGRRQ